MKVPDLAGLFDRRADLLRQVADVDSQIAHVFQTAVESEPEDAVLSLQEAALFMGERPGSFRRRPIYLRARISLPTERRARYSRNALAQIKRDRLEAAAMVRQ